MPSEEQEREDKALDYLIAHCFDEYFLGEPTDEEIAEFMNDDYELTPEDQAVLDEMAPTPIITDFIINKSGRANGSLLVWDCEILEKNSESCQLDGDSVD